MKYGKRVVLSLLLLGLLAAAPRVSAQGNAAKPETKAAASAEASTAKKNIQAYIELLRKDIRQQKAEVMGATMLLSAADAAKFWPIYSDYEAELAKLNDQRVANILEYAHLYSQLTDEQADGLMAKAFAYQKQRIDLFEKTYDRIKQALGGVTAARFAQIESQLLLILDLQIDSSLPIAGQ